jgi:hypothetical protein
MIADPQPAKMVVVQETKSTNDPPSKVEPMTFTAADIRTIVLLLQSPEPVVVQGVLEWILKHAEKCRALQIGATHRAF